VFERLKIVSEVEKVGKCTGMPYLQCFIPRVKYIDCVLLLVFFSLFIHLRNKCVFPFIKLQVEHNN
jgi:hypothetical protein